jgi:enamine deaminase RidA (YjgF/YER057c/UK114 family)
MVAKKINPESMAPAIGFSHAVVVEGGTLVFLAGQTALNKEGVIEGNGIVEQFEKVTSSQGWDRSMKSMNQALRE